jgi:hypothetical protein
LKPTGSHFRIGLACLMISILLWPAHLSAQTVGVKLDAEQLRVSVPQMHFVGAEVLQRLRNGIAVNYVFKVGVTSSRTSKPATESIYRFVISYDIFEEKFAVSRIEPNPRSITHLSEAAAEQWCLDSIAIPVAGLPADRSFWVTMEYQTAEPKAATDSSESIIGQLIDVFSKKAQREESRGSVIGGPFNLQDLRKAR